MTHSSLPWRSVPWLVPAVLTAAACSSPAPVATSPHTTSTISHEWFLEPLSTLVLVLVVDDSPDADGIALRERVAGSVQSWLSDIRWQRFSWCGSPDPAAWHPGDLRVLVVHPSAPDDERLVTPADDPALAWITQTSAEEEIAPVVAGVTGALSARTAKIGERYRPLRAARRAMELASRTAQPATPSESAFVTSLPETTWVQTLVASTHDDDDDTDPSALLPAAAARERAFALDLVGPFTPYPAGSCLADDAGTTRLQAWAKATGLYGRRTTWPCGEDDAWSLVLSLSFVDCGPVCRSYLPATSSDGRADCRVTVDSAHLDGCDPARGHRDPEGGPSHVERDGETLRRCEVVQLQGAALESCRTSLDCPGCGSGFCATEVPELVPASWCDGDLRPWPLRYTGGALQGVDGWVGVTCTIVPIE